MSADLLRGRIKSREKRRWHFLNALGLTKAFTPALVCETVTKDSGGNFEVTMSGPTGRVFGVFKPRSRKSLVLHATKFSSPWSNLDHKRRAAKLCYLSSVIADNSLPVKAIKPLVRLAAQYNRLGWINFKGLIKSVVACVAPKSNTKVRQLSMRRSRKCCNPSFTRGVQILPDGRLSLPLWKWIPQLGSSPT